MALEAAAADLVRQAGEYLLRQQPEHLAVTYKDPRGHDPVSEADRTVQRLVQERLATLFPADAFLGEEEPAGTAPAARRLWVLDPVDGTLNYLAGLPLYAVSLAVLVAGRPVAGAIALPAGRDVLVVQARWGGGITWAGSPVRLETRPADRPLLIGVPGGLAGQFRWRRRPGKLVEARTLGSIAVELALAARGSLDYVVFRRPRAWDVAAGVLLVQEAGGVVLEWAGRRQGWRVFSGFGLATGLRQWSRPLLAGSPAAVAEVAQSLVPVEPPLWWRLGHGLIRWWRESQRGPDRPQARGPVSQLR